MQKTEIINGLEAMVDTLDGFGAEDPQSKTPQGIAR